MTTCAESMFTGHECFHRLIDYRFFWAYRDVACTIYPVVPDPPQFEATLNYMLSNRAKAQAGDLPLDPTNPYGISLSWLALVFAVFASGAQCTRLPAKERELTSQVYSKCFTLSEPETFSDTI